MTTVSGQPFRKSVFPRRLSKTEHILEFLTVKISAFNGNGSAQEMQVTFRCKELSPLESSQKSPLWLSRKFRNGDVNYWRFCSQIFCHFDFYQPNRNKQHWCEVLRAWTKKHKILKFFISNFVMVWKIPYIHLILFSIVDQIFFDFFLLS